MESIIMYACFVNSEEQPNKVKHICYYVKKSFEELLLIEVVEEEFNHPDEPEYAIVFRMNERVIKSIPSGRIEAAPLIVLMAAEQTVESIFNVKLERKS